MRLIRPALGALLLLTLTACGTAPEDEGETYGRTLRDPDAVATYEGVSADQYAACVSRAVEIYVEADDHEAFIDGCVLGARM